MAKSLLFCERPEVTYWLKNASILPNPLRGHLLRNGNALQSQSAFKALNVRKNGINPLSSPYSGPDSQC